MKKIPVFLATGMLLAGSAQAEMIPLTAELKAPNQDGSNPDVIFDPQGIVPTSSTGTFSAILDTEAMVLTEVFLSVEGMVEADLLGFGPNSTPFHIHLPNNGTGTFGFNVIDLPFQEDASAFTYTATGFSWESDSISILEEDQGAINGAGLHPGNDLIVDALLSGDAFILVHSTKDIFTNVNHPPQFEDGFPFAEQRGEIVASVVPVPAAAWLLLSGMSVLGVVARRRAA